MRSPARMLLRQRIPAENARRCVDGHVAAIDVQRAARGWLARLRMRWTRRPEWPQLRSEIVAARGGSRAVLATLAARPGVRLEWACEPSSWLMMLRSPEGAATLRVILDECRAGSWGVDEIDLI